MTVMASSTTLSLPFNFSPSSFSPRNFRSSPGIFHLSPLAKKISRSLSASRSVSALAPLLPLGGEAFSVAYPAQNPRSITVVSAKGYKMKTHKASAKRFRVTGSGKIMRRRAGKQHLLRKKNAKRRLRLSKMLQVDRSDYNNVIGALPYLKVNRQK
ncbi:60S ribosomal protein L35 [Sarracenia purpurea var. burkii]